MHRLRLPAEELVLRLHQQKAEMMQQEERARQGLKAFFKQIRECLQHGEVELLRKLDKEMLNFHEAAASTLKIVGKLKGSSDEDSLDNAMEMVSCRVIHGTKVDAEQLKELLRQVYFVKVGANHEDSRIELPEMADSRASQQQRMYSESAVEKIQCERDYYQKREEELMNKIREFECSRKGANIRQLSKSALEEKCSKWAIDRLREEKRVLIEKIGEASQQIMRQDTLLSEYQEEIKKLSYLVGDSNGKSLVGNSSIKSASVIVQSEANHERQYELQVKNAQLTLQITSHMQRLQEIYEANKQLQQDLEKTKAEQAIMQSQLSDLQQENAMINDDYEANLRKKAAIEQQCNELKKDYDDLMSKAQEERIIMQSLIEGVKLAEQEIKKKLKRTEAEKRAEIFSMEQKLANSHEEREKLLRKIENISSKSGEQINFKQLLNDEIARLLKQNAQLEREINMKENLAFEAKEESAKLELELKGSVKKTDSLKKENSQFKKSMKESDKQKNELKTKLTLMENLQFKVQQLQQHFTHLQNEFSKNKDVNERKTAQHEKVMAVFKERYNLQLSQLLAEDNKKPKKEKSSKMEVIEKYIEEMVAFSSKTAQIRQLKEEIRELKDKEGRDIKKKQKTSMEESVSLIEWGMYNTNSKIFEQRLKNQKEIFEERLNQMAQLLNKEELIKNALNEQLEKQKLSVLQMKNRQKQERIVDETAKNVKQLQEKVERLQEESKKVRVKNKKLQSDLSDAQSQAKTKKELNAGLRSQIKAKEDIIIQLYKDIDSLKSEIDKLQRNTRQMCNKQELLRQSKELYKKIQFEKEQLLQVLEELTEKNKQLTRQVSKKDEVIKELSFIQGKESKKKDDLLIKSMNNQITDLKEANRKLKMDNDRKDEIIKNSKAKLEVKSKENEDVNMRISKDCEKATKDKEVLQRKLQSTASNLKKEQLKSSSLSWAIKKIFEMCSKVTSRPEKESTKGKPETTQYYTNSSISPHTLKMGTPASNLKSFISCEGLEILNLRPEDIEECLGAQSNTVNKTDLGESWCMASPIINNRREQEKRQAMLQGLQELQRILNSKELSCNLLLEQFKQILDK